MADNTLTTRILLRYDTYNNWMNSDVILLPGEAAIAAFPDPDTTKPPRAVGIKMGDGQHYFEELPWIQAIAADVYNWAKEIDKPAYQATEIIGLAEYIAAHSSGGGGGSSGAGSGIYRIIYDTASSKYLLQQYNEDTGEWESTTSEIDLSSILNRLNTIERWANGAVTGLGAIELPISGIVYDEVVGYMNRLDVNDLAVPHEFVTSVEQSDGRISVTRSIITAEDITSGVFQTSQGGTGLTRVEEDEVLIGSQDGTITTRTFVTYLDPSDRNSFATSGAIIDYITEKTAGLTGAMHFIGESSVIIDGSANSRVDPQIPGYNFRNAQPGDVILAGNAQEYVWTGSNWRLLGDEGSYAVKGSIVNTDVSENAAISQSKIDGLTDSFNEKVDKVEGKQLSSNDYTDDEKTKLSEIEDGAQANIIEHITVNDTEILPDSNKTINLDIPAFTDEQIETINTAQSNVIEHIFVNGIEIPPTTINEQTKSVGITFTPFTQEEKDKLHDIEAGAEVNKIETISFNGGNPISPDNNKNIDITIDPTALHLNVLEGARYPSGNTYVDIEKDPTNKKLELSKVAATGNINDLIQTSGTFVIFNCGSSTEVI